jgi:hypothetical protein
MCLHKLNLQGSSCSGRSEDRWGEGRREWADTLFERVPFIRTPHGVFRLFIHSCPVHPHICTKDIPGRVPWISFHNTKNNLKVKVNKSLCLTVMPWRRAVGSGGIHAAITSVLDGHEWPSSRSGRFIPGKTSHCTHCKADCVSRSGHGAEEEQSLPLPGIEIWSSSPKPSHYTDWATPGSTEQPNKGHRCYHTEGKKWKGKMKVKGAQYLTTFPNYVETPLVIHYKII